MDDRFERRCRFLLRAYPPRHREFRGEELVGTLLDAASPDQVSPSLRDTWDIVRGGLVFRLRDRPPLRHWLAYRLLGRRVPYRWRWWARDEAMGLFAYQRNAFFSLMAGWGTIVLLSLALGTPISAFLWWMPAVFLAAAAVPVPAFRRSARHNVLRKHEFNPDGTTMTPVQPDESRT